MSSSSKIQEIGSGSDAALPDESEYESDDYEDVDVPLLERVSDRLCPTLRTVKAYTCMTMAKAGSLAWVLATSFLLLGFPLAISMEREASLIELDKQLKGQGMPMQ